MGRPQREFLEQFQRAFEDRLGPPVRWMGGQGLENRAQLPPSKDLRRNGTVRRDESFEIGDLRVDHCGLTVVIEYDGEGVQVHNLLKYWPYIRGELSANPPAALLFCHFSNWASWGSYRDLWSWLERQMSSDPARIVNFKGRQFDHGGKDQSRRQKSIWQAIEWLRRELRGTGP